MHDEMEPQVPDHEDSLELPLARLPGVHPCHACAACCRYVAIEIDAPTTNKDYDHIFWYVAHRDVSVYVDWEGDWYIEFQTVCEYLTEDGTCGIYRDRPQICSDFSWNDCEKATGEPASKLHLRSPAELLAWMEEKRPRAFARYQAHREKLVAGREKRAANLRARGAASPAES